MWMMEVIELESERHFAKLTTWTFYENSHLDYIAQLAHSLTLVPIASNCQLPTAKRSKYQYHCQAKCSVCVCVDTNQKLSKCKLSKCSIRYSIRCCSCLISKLQWNRISIYLLVLASSPHQRCKDPDRD